jgi:hypothetical protein
MDQLAFDRTPHERRCWCCGEVKAVKEFNRKGGGLQARCRQCNAAYLREHYQKNRDYYVAKARRYQRQRRRDYRRWLLGFFADHPCVDCGETDPVVLQFDHVRQTKLSEIANMVNSGYSWAKIEAEMAKCVVRCSNCHWRRTAKQFGWYAYMEDDGDRG